MDEKNTTELPSKTAKKAKRGHEKRTKKIDIRFTEAEYLSLMKAFDASPYGKKSTFLRAKLFSKKISQSHQKRHQAFISAGKLSTEINKIGRNFNQLVHGINTFKTVELTTEQVQVIRNLGYKLAELQSIFEESSL